MREYRGATRLAWEITVMTILTVLFTSLLIGLLSAQYRLLIVSATMLVLYAATLFIRALLYG